MNLTAIDNFFVCVDDWVWALMSALSVHDLIMQLIYPSININIADKDKLQLFNYNKLHSYCAIT